AIYYYGIDGRGPCFIIEGEKTHLSLFRNYLVVVSKHPISKKKKLNEDGYESGEEEFYGFEHRPNGSVLTLYDLKNKYIAFTGSFSLFGDQISSIAPDTAGIPIKSVFACSGDLFVLTTDSRIYRLEEKDLSTKLEQLFQKNMYPLALNIVTSSPPPLDTATLSEIHKRYADFAYTRGDFDLAISQYQQTLEHLEPSYVIRKFLDANRIHNLTAYLQTLHTAGKAKTDHTTLLLNCYTKLKATSQLAEFVRSSTPFDVETAIRVLRQATYFDHAQYLAARFELHSWHLKIQLDDLKHYDGAVEYLAALPPALAVREVEKYAAVLVRQKPEEMTALLVRLCGEVESRIALASFVDGGRVESLDGVDPLRFVHCFVDLAGWCAVFLERVVAKRWANGVRDREDREEEIMFRGVCNTLLELYLAEGAGEKREEKALALLKNPNVSCLLIFEF
ncbi:Vacuolar protein sorting-associated protein 11, partial [Nowakowskiella sp. JEL0078]